jgi:hypothetical protein
VPKYEHCQRDRADNIPHWRPEEAEEGLGCLRADSLLGVTHASTELSQKWRQVCNQKPAVNGPAKGGHNCCDGATGLSVNADILVTKALMHSTH